MRDREKRVGVEKERGALGGCREGKWGCRLIVEKDSDTHTYTPICSHNAVVRWEGTASSCQPGADATLYTERPLRGRTVGSGPRYQILSHVFARCPSQKTYGHARIAFSHGRRFFDSRNMQKCVAQIIYLGPLPSGPGGGVGWRAGWGRVGWGGRQAVGQDHDEGGVMGRIGPVGPWGLVGCVVAGLVGRRVAGISRLQGTFIQPESVCVLAE